jgi:alkanesulfonate monooxygenase SsuD/methylene tetrahydromethanopterin reductase-like flavin-dependent oxidoreductase (luciferase family)
VADSVTRRCKVGIVLPTYEGMYGKRTAGWNDIRAMAQRADELEYDSVWVFDHVLLPLDRWGLASQPLGIWEGWSIIAGLAAVTNRIEIGALVSCTNFRNPALLAKMADAVDEISGGRLILGIGAGSVEEEFGRFGFPADHRASRFEEAVQIIRPLLRGETVSFQGRFYQTDEAVLRPRGTRPNGPPILIGTRRPRLHRIAAKYADMWNAPWQNRAELVAPIIGEIDAACQAVGRDPTTLSHTAGVMVDVEEAGPNRDWIWTRLARDPAEPIGGSIEEVAAALHEYTCLGVEHLQVWLNPCTLEGLEAFAPVLSIMDRHSD